MKNQSLKQIIEQEDADPTDEKQSEPKGFLLRQKDISIGAGLMFIGGIVAVLWSFVIGPGSMDVLLPQAFFILGFTLAFVLLFFHPLIRSLHKLFSNNEEQQPELLSKQQNGINLGAILMFIGTLKAMLIATFMQPASRAVTTLLIMSAGFLILLVIRKAVETVYQMLFKGEIREEEAVSVLGTTDLAEQLNAFSGENALPPAQSVSAKDYVPPSARGVTAKIVQPPTVTEGTTQFLDKQ